MIDKLLIHDLQLLLLFCLTLGLSASAWAASPMIAAQFVPRGGLPNVAAKLNAGQDVSVVFIGGSITRGGGSSSYVQQTQDWLRETYPDATIAVYNAGISGTDSNFGAKRFDRDVLIHEPDLVLIEFAVNDGNRDHTQHMERMVHKAWRANPDTDLAFFYTLSQDHLDDYAKGHLPTAASAHERVAQHYGIPTIGLAHDVAQKLNTGEIDWSAFAHDKVHPHQGGYALFNTTFRAVLPELLALGRPGPNELKTPMTQGLVIYPPPVEAEPLDVPVFVDPDGNRAIASYAIPVPAKHWVSEPVFADETGKPLWRLHWIDKSKTKAMDSTVGLTKADWSGNEQDWFGENRCFTGPEGNALYEQQPAGKVCLRFSGLESGVLVFVAPETGRYRLRVSHDAIGVWGSEDKTFGLNVAYFPWGADQGKSLASYRAVKQGMQPWSESLEISMTAGEELALIASTDSPRWIRGGWLNLQLNIGLMEQADGP